MNLASETIAQSLPNGVRNTYAARSEHDNYSNREKEKALGKLLLLMSNLGQPVRVKYLRSLALSINRQRSMKKSIKRPRKIWPRVSEKLIDWKRHQNNIHKKMEEWFDMISQVLQNPRILPENVYNIDETGVMLSILGWAKVLFSKDDR
ncbi:hypothetical protein J3E71DRAFT_360473 [Bipolaris maydis]|nr:hypothetical protein J3E71DRAFT_360473 [Bipolaris maydis]